MTKKASRGHLLSAPPQTIPKGGLGGPAPPPDSAECRVLLQGVDTLYASCFVEWSDASDDTIHRLSAARDAAKVDVGGGLVQLTDTIQAIVHPTGSRKADGPYYDLRFSVLGFDVELRSPERQHQQVPDVVIKCGAVKCMENGNSIRALWKDCQSLFELLGCECLLGLPSRVDRFFDCSSPFAILNEAHGAGDLVTRGRQVDEYGTMVPCKVTRHRTGLIPDGFSVGADLKLRCYDKRRELISGTDKHLLLEARWQHAGDVSRVEFQLRRESLKKRGIVTMDDLIEKWEPLSSYLVKKWAVFRVGAGRSRTNLRKKPVHPFWKVLQSQFDLANVAPLSWMEAQHNKRRDDQWLSQIRGCLLSWAAEYATEDAQAWLDICDIVPDLLIEDGIERSVQILKERAHYRHAKMGGGVVEAELLRLRAVRRFVVCDEVTDSPAFAALKERLYLRRLEQQGADDQLRREAEKRRQASMQGGLSCS